MCWRPQISSEINKILNKLFFLFFGILQLDIILCQPISGIPGRRHLCSAGRGELDFPYQPGHVRKDGPTSVLHPGIRCLTVSRTLILVSKPSNAILRPFPHISTLSVFEVLTKTHYINPLVILSCTSVNIAVFSEHMNSPLPTVSAILPITLCFRNVFFMQRCNMKVM